MITSSDAQRFQEQGYLIARGVFAGDELERYRELARQVQAKAKQQLLPGMRYWFGAGKPKEYRDTQPPDVRAAASWGINELPRRELFEPDLVNVFGHEQVDQIMNTLLDQPRAWGIKMLWTPKVVGYDLGWHRDQLKHELYDWVQYKPSAQDHVQFNAALNQDHCFLVVPGSHRRALTEQEWDAVGSNTELPGEVVADLEPGDIVFMDAHTLHRGRCGVETDRLTLHYSAQSQWVPMKPWGHEGHMEWLMSEEFLSQLSERTKPHYERLHTAERTDQSMGFVKAAAAEHGWQPA
jgi:hypothetical protein